MMYWDNGHMSAGWGVMMMLGMLTFWLLIAFGILWSIRSTRAAHAAAAMSSSGAEQILGERLARGEIEPEDYRTRMTALTAPK